ncbi:MAG: GatB/YqeY domain-containing protein [Chloroflexi bacterium]|nr:GatB/YqeY domain-containing protein [Chloroflexota bacterium]MCL5275362.1 GatB/YqeY domain-containing protein [Chloroflexota bacterium]
MDLTIKQRLQNDLKESMRGGDERRKTVVRLLMASIRNAEVDARTDGRGGVVSESDIMALLRREIKQHEESLIEAMKAKRADLVSEQSGELDILRSYLPAQMSREQIVEQARQVIGELQATSPKQQGEVMKALLPKVKDMADGKLVSEVVRELLK